MEFIRNLINESYEVVQEDGNIEYKSFQKWQHAVHNLKPDVKITGDVYNAKADGIGEWKGDHGIVFKDSKKEENDKKSEEDLEESDKSLKHYLRIVKNEKKTK